MTSSNDIRQKFIDFFVAKGHELVPSSSLVPHNDATLLFTNAGMVQFKDVFLGREQRSCRRATSAQRCVRAGGKHNDLENVGYTARHHTFFEMLGNFSFGDYFKREAIEFAWEFLTQAIDLPADRLWVTVYEEDNEAADIWLHDIGLDPGRLARIGATDNFWRMGDTGPCGPCSEIFYDHGPRISGGPPGSATADGDRFVEIWNLVFMEFNRSADGRLTPLPHPAVDTGMGLERLAAVLQGVYDNYDTDLFRHLIGAATDLLAVADPTSRSLRVIADHIRACAFLIADGVAPGNEGRGYVLRRLVRRAIRHGHQLGASEPFFYRLVAPLEQQMGVAYPILGEQSRNVQRVLREEEERFAETLAQGMHLLNQDLARLSGDTLSGATLFRLYDTYGFPVDLTADIVRERGLSVDMEGFEAAMQEQRTRARAASHFVATEVPEVAVSMHTEFTGYERLADQAEVVGLLRDGATLARLDAGDDAIVILDRTPFYAESGGQVGDHGYLELAGGRFEVTDARKLGDTAIGHSGRLLSGALAIGDRVTARVAADDRQATALNHSATHLLHAALRQVLGGQVTQKGSLVDAHRLRFDFSNPRQVTQQELQTVEALVNDHIRANHEVQTAVMGMDDAVRSGAMALFGEKYGAQVRVLRMDDFSVELCGGTHVRRTGDIGLFKILSESGVASGIRRIEAMTGAKAVAWTEDQAAIVRDLSARLQTGPAMLGDKLAQLLLRQKALEKELAQVQGRLASHSGDDLGGRAVVVGDAKVLAARVDAEPKALRELVDQLKNKLGRAVVLVAAVNDGKVNLVAGVTGDLTDRVAAGDLVNQVALQVGGKGGGRADMAMAGGKDPTHLDQALAGVVPWVAERLGVSG